MGRILKYGTPTLGLGLAVLLGVSVAGLGTAAARPAHPAAVAAPADPTLGRAPTLSAPPHGAAPTVLAPAIKICSFNGTRSRAPFATATGTLGYGHMRAALLDPANFGPGGTVHRTILIAPGVSTITSAGLAGCNVFFTSVFTGRLSATEASALKTAYQRGMRVVTDADSDSAEMSSVNSVLVALGFSAAFGGALACPNSATGGAVRSAGPADTAVYGPFGDLRGNTWGTSISAVMKGHPAMVTCGSATVRLVKHRRRVLVGGDPSGFNLFTAPSEALFNPTNEAAYLNFIGGAH